MSLIELMCASGGLGVALGVALSGYNSFGIIGAIIGIPIGFIW